MNKFYLHLFTFFILSAHPLSSQTSKANFANWKDNKKAAYTIIHDDFSNYVTGIYQYADTIANNRGIKLCFGAITSACGATEWAKARTMIAHGHECVNHSHNHKCGGTASQCSGLTRYSKNDFATELKLSSQLIETNTGVKPRFFIHPYDASSSDIINYLRDSLGYLGTRAGTQATINSNSFTSFMNLNYFVYDGSAASLAGLDPAVNTAIAAGGYAVREFHGIDDGSWGAMTVANYTKHLDYVQSKIIDGSLWSATTTEAITYKMQKDAFTPFPVFDAIAGKITVSFLKIKTINTSVLVTPVTLNVDVTGSTGNFTAQQNGVTIPVVRNGNSLSVNIYPHKGTIVFNGNIVPPPSPPACVQNGKVVHQVWTNINLNTWTLDALKTDSRYPNNPTSTDTLTALSKTDLGDMYGEKTFGFFVPKTTGIYTFTITGDDDAELYLSTTGNAADKVKICGFTGFTDVAEYTKYASQTSASITLTAGKYYYIEALHIGTVGVTNHFHTYLTEPGSTIKIAIDNKWLSSKNCDLINTPALAQSAEYFNLTGRLIENKAVISWAAKFSDEKDYFVLEKLSDKTGYFEEIDIINATSSGKSIDYFTHTDSEIIEGDNFYRLKIVGLTTETYSETVKIHYERPNAYLLFPNPAHDYVDIDLSQATKGKSVEIAVVTLLGKVVYESKLEAAGSEFHHIPLENLENGQYFVRIQAEGKKMVMKKLMIIK